MLLLTEWESELLTIDCEHVAARFEQAWEDPAIRRAAGKAPVSLQASVRFHLALAAARENLTRRGD